MLFDGNTRAGIRSRAGLARTAILTAAVPCLLLASGCSTGPVPARREAPVAGHMGGSWEALYLTPRAAELLADIDPADLPEYARRDSDLSLTIEGPLLASSQWPQPPRLTVERARRLNIPVNANSQLFLLPERTFDHRPRAADR